MAALKQAFTRTACAALLVLFFVEWRSALFLAGLNAVVLVAETAVAVRRERGERRQLRERRRQRLERARQVKAALNAVEKAAAARPAPLHVVERRGRLEIAEADEGDMRRINNYRWN